MRIDVVRLKQARANLQSARELLQGQRIPAGITHHIESSITRLDSLIATEEAWGDEAFPINDS